MLGETISSKRKPKEGVNLLAEKARNNEELTSELLDFFKTGSVTEKGLCM